VTSTWLCARARSEWAKHRQRIAIRARTALRPDLEFSIGYGTVSRFCHQIGAVRQTSLRNRASPRSLTLRTHGAEHGRQ
jgi:hypothetical protein